VQGRVSWCVVWHACAAHVCTDLLSACVYIHVRSISHTLSCICRTHMRRTIRYPRTSFATLGAPFRFRHLSKTYRRPIRNLFSPPNGANDLPSIGVGLRFGASMRSAIGSGRGFGASMRSAIDSGRGFGAPKRSVKDVGKMAVDCTHI